MIKALNEYKLYLSLRIDSKYELKLPLNTIVAKIFSDFQS